MMELMGVVFVAVGLGILLLHDFVLGIGVPALVVGVALLTQRGRE